ncbi:MAG: 6-phosphofructokinase [Puniceicoccales bacterium]|jgi:6-phosphofructokinase 1|nr:6-phosphofructokinase [Puniceicoccales bacterium]
MMKLNGNVLLMQLGRPSALMNVGLSALIGSALNYDAVEDVYGCIGGLAGLIAGNFIDLAAQQQKNISNLSFTPGAALGSRVSECSEEDFSNVGVILRDKNIRFMFILGDEESGKYCLKIEESVARIGHEMRLMLIPFSPDNALPLTDHCLGYGSLIKHVSSLFTGIVADIQSTQSSGSVTIVEFSGCDNMWVLCGVALAKKRFDSNMAPHLIFADLFEEQTLVKKIHECIHANGNCVIVVGGDLKNRAGESVTKGRTPGQHVKFIAEANFEVDVDLVILHDWRRTSCMTISGADSSETVNCARRAVELALENVTSSKMMILLRTDIQKYNCEISCVDISNAIGKKKEFPLGWYNGDETIADTSFFKYASPLIIGETHPAYDSGIQILAKFR